MEEPAQPLEHEIGSHSKRNIELSTLRSVAKGELIERCEKREMRKKLNSMDDENTELYDQFYRDHQLLLKLFVILGVMPVERKWGKVIFEWKSYQMLYALLLYMFTTYLVVKVGAERIRLFQTIEQFDEYIYAVVFIIFLVPHFLIPYIGWSVATEVAQYKSMWGPFQVRYYKVTGSLLTFPELNALIIKLFIGCVLLSVAFLLCLSRLLEGFPLWHTTAYFHIITTINMNAALFFINSKGIKDAGIDLAAVLKKDLALDCNAELLAKYRVLWLNLSEILRMFGRAYSRTYSMYCLLMSVNITIGAYGAISEMIGSGLSPKVLGLIILTLYSAILLLIICDCADRTTSVLTTGVQDILFTVNLTKCDMYMKKEIDHFILTIKHGCTHIDMEGYGLIDRNLITKIISTIAIYLIILLQFKISTL